MNDRVALVTGAARGIGAAIATRLAADGFTIGVLDLEESACAGTVDAIVAAGGRAAGFAIDVSNEESVSKAIDAVASTLGAPTVLVNNAGITRDNLLFKMSLSDWDSVMGVHLRGAFLMTRAVQTFMVEAKWGRVVTMSSASAMGNRGQANYSAAKAGLQGFTRTVAIELGPFGVTANAIAPGFIETEMTVKTAERLGIGFEEFKAQVASTTPVRRVGQPSDIAGTVSYFVSDDASFVSGQILYVTGGPSW